MGKLPDKTGSPGQPSPVKGFHACVIVMIEALEIGSFVG